MSRKPYPLPDPLRRFCTYCGKEYHFRFRYPHGPYCSRRHKLEDKQAKAAFYRRNYRPIWDAQQPETVPENQIRRGRPRGPDRPIHKGPTPDMLKAMHERRFAGRTLADIGREMGLTRERVRRLVARGEDLALAQPGCPSVRHVVAGDKTGRELVYYNRFGPRRVEHRAAGTCTYWLDQWDAEWLRHNPEDLAKMPLQFKIEPGKE